MTLTVPVSKNRVGEFFYDPSFCTWDSSGSDQCLQWENGVTTTAIASGANYYGFRYYNPNLGRWLNRDPLGDQGSFHLFLTVDSWATEWIDQNPILEMSAEGQNLYDILLNDVINYEDYLGLMGRRPRKLPKRAPKLPPNPKDAVDLAVGVANVECIKARRAYDDCLIEEMQKPGCIDCSKLENKMEAACNLSKKINRKQ